MEEGREEGVLCLLKLSGVPGGIRTLVTAVKWRHPIVTYSKLRHGWLPLAQLGMVRNCYRTLIEPSNLGPLFQSETSCSRPVLTILDESPHGHVLGSPEV